MKKEVIKKFLAAGVSVAMIAGSAIPAFAASGDGLTNSGDGEGTSTGHLNDTYVEASVPTDKTIAGLFSFYVDPEDIIALGGKFDGTTAVTPVSDLVYFPDASGGFAATSQPLEITVKNYRAVDVVVTATVDANTTGLIPLVDSATGIDNTAAADDAALYLDLKVGSENAVPILSTGATSTYQQASQSGNFDVTGSVEAGFSVAPKSSPTSDWAKVAIVMSGKAQKVKDATGIVAPKVTLAYTIGLHQDSYTVTYNAGYGETPATATETVLNNAHPAGTAEAVVALKTREGYTFAGWFDGTGDDAEEVTISEISAATTVYAKWTKDPTVAFAGYSAGTNKRFWIGSADGVGFADIADAGSTLENVKIDGADITSGATYDANGYVYITWAGAAAAGITWQTGHELEITFTLDGVDYIATYTL